MAERWDERERVYRSGERDRSDRAADEVRSWFGDDEAAQRRRMDEYRDSREHRDWNDSGPTAMKRAWNRSTETMREATDRDRDGRRGFAEWNDNDRPSWDRGRSGPAWDASRYRDEYGTRNRGYTDSPGYASGSYTGSQWNSANETRYSGYAGRGPKGYRRGDERIREEVCDRLTDDARIDASDIDVQVKDGEVTLAGSVRTREEKRFTEDLIERISGVRDVNNHLKVKAADEVIGTARSGASVLGLTDAPPPPPSKTTK